MRKCLSHVVDVDERLAHVKRAGAQRLALLRCRAHVPQAPSQELVDQFLEIHIALATQPLELHRYVIVNGQCRSHTSKHKGIDALMSTARPWQPGRCGLLRPFMRKM